MSEEIPPSGSLGPASCVVWGTARADLDRLAMGVARMLGKEVYWVEIQGEPSLPSEEAAVLQELDPTHSLRVAPPEVAINEELGKLALWAVVREPSTSLEDLELSDYLRIPGPFRSLIDHAGPVPGGVTIVVANVDRATHFYGGEPGEFTPFLLELKRLGVSIIFTNGGMPRGNTSDFDIVIRVLSPPAEPGARVCCSRADSRFGNRLSVGVSVPLTDFLAALRNP